MLNTNFPSISPNNLFSNLSVNAVMETIKNNMTKGNMMNMNMGNNINNNIPRSSDFVEPSQNPNMIPVRNFSNPPPQPSDSFPSPNNNTANTNNNINNNFNNRGGPPNFNNDNFMNMRGHLNMFDDGRRYNTVNNFLNNRNPNTNNFPRNSGGFNTPSKSNFPKNNSKPNKNITPPKNKFNSDKNTRNNTNNNNITPLKKSPNFKDKSTSLEDAQFYLKKWIQDNIEYFPMGKSEFYQISLYMPLISLVSPQ